MAALEGIEVGALLADDALRVAHRDVLNPGGLEHLADADAGGAGAVHDHLERGERTVREHGVVHDARERDDGGSPLVVVKDGDVELGVEPVLDLEAGGGGDVLEVDAAILRGDRLHRGDHALRVGAARVGAALAAACERHRPRVDVAEGLEEDRLALHHRDGGGGPEVAEAEDGGAVGDDRHEVGLGRRLVDRLGALGDRADRVGHPGRVGEAEVVLGPERPRQSDRDLSAAVVGEHLFASESGHRQPQPLAFSKSSMKETSASTPSIGKAL